MSNKTANITHAERCLDLQSGTRKLIRCRKPAAAIWGVVILIAGNSFILKAQSSRSAFVVDVPAILTQQTIISINKKDTINKKATQTTADNSTGMVLLELDKQEHPVKKAENNATPLDEAMVMAYTAKKKMANDADAHPQAGWDSFKKYIQDKAVAPNGKTGTVQLSFLVNTDGKLSDFKIVDGFNDTVNKAAIDMIKNGPTWVNASNGQPKTVNVKINFH